MSDRILFLFTKKFPFGHQETYLFDELPFLSASFKEVIIIPHDEFEYNESKNRLPDQFHNIRVLAINQLHSDQPASGFLYREFLIHKILLSELFFGRDSWNHLKRFFNLAGQLRHLFKSAQILKNFIKKSKYVPGDIIMYNYWLHRGVIISGMLNYIMGGPAVKVISRAHSFDLYHKNWFKFSYLPSKLFLPFERWKLKHVDLLFPISDHGNKHLLATFPFLSGKIIVSRLGVKESSSRINYSYRNSDLLFVTCSSITTNKRLYLVPEIVGKMKIRVKWVHFGGGDENEIRKIMKHCKANALSEQVMEFKGKTSKKEILKFYETNQIDLFLNVSLAEGIPVALMEAASFAIPLLATNTVGNPEIVNNENGFIVDVHFDANETAKQLDDFFMNSDVVKRKRQASFDTFDKLYNAEKNFPKFIQEIING